MCNLFRISCPPIEIPQAKRIDFVYKELENWVFSSPISELVSFCGGEPPKLAFKEHVAWLKDFGSTHWDFRKKQNKTKDGEKARWLLLENDFLKENKESIYKIATELGLVGSYEPTVCNPDYILILGGARLSNYDRSTLAKQLVDKYEFTETEIVGLSTYRPIDLSERSFIDSYAPTAKFEFEALVSGMDTVFEANGLYSKKISCFKNPNKNFGICTFSNQYKGNRLYTLASPSKDPLNRRANSEDCFEFFFNQFNVKPGSKLLNCTSQIYCSYQHVRALTLAIKHHVFFETVGCTLSAKKNNLNATHYVQEIKATIDEIYNFIEEFKKG